MEKISCTSTEAGFVLGLHKENGQYLGFTLLVHLWYGVPLVDVNMSLSPYFT